MLFENGMNSQLFHVYYWIQTVLDGYIIINVYWNAVIFGFVSKYAVSFLVHAGGMCATCQATGMTGTTAKFVTGVAGLASYVCAAMSVNRKDLSYLE